MNRMIGVGEFCTSSITERRRCSNSPFIDAPACISPISSAHTFTPRSGGGTSPAAIALRKSFHNRGLPDAGFAGQDRIVLPAAHQHVDDLPDFLVAAEDRVHFARSRLGGEILREAVERGGAAWPRRPPRRACRPRAAPSHPSGGDFLRPNCARSRDARRRACRR